MQTSKRGFDAVKRLLAERLFTDKQIDKIIPHLQDQYLAKPEYLEEIINTWNNLMHHSGPVAESCLPPGSVPSVAKPTSNFPIKAKQSIDMNYILADVEPRLLLLHPQKLLERHGKIETLEIARTANEHWLLLLHAPRGFYLQKWSDLMKKFFYVQDNILDFLFDKKKQKDLIRHPILNNAAIMEADLDHIRTRYLFSQRSGYVSLAHLYPIRMPSDEPDLCDLILTSDKDFLKKFAPFCSIEEYSVFSDLMKNHELDEDDLEVVNKLADLNSV